LATSPVPEVVTQHSLRHHFATLEQQRQSSTLGMWIFLVTEIMFFGGLFTAYLIYRVDHPSIWLEGARHMEFGLGTLNTIILLTSSFTVALGVNFAQLGKTKITAILLMATVVMGLGFLGVKSIEYYNHYVEGTVPGPWWNVEKIKEADAKHWLEEHKNEPNAQPPEETVPNELQLFFYIYFVMTGLHALHVTIGIVALTFIAVWSWKGKYSKEYHTPVHITGLYWHFVDLVWIFLYPLLYLIANKHT
jgi:cytochrome c oxidase subunit 3